MLLEPQSKRALSESQKDAGCQGYTYRGRLIGRLGKKEISPEFSCVWYACIAQTRYAGRRCFGHFVLFGIFHFKQRKHGVAGFLGEKRIVNTLSVKIRREKWIDKRRQFQDEQQEVGLTPSFKRNYLPQACSISVSVIIIVKTCLRMLLLIHLRLSL